MSNVGKRERLSQNFVLSLWDNTVVTLSDMDKELQKLEQRLGKTRQIKQGMMQELLTGRTRLPLSTKQ
nr:hypothetical protein [uncultured Amphritea sp.]